jgi:hypothetical protein
MKLGELGILEMTVVILIEMCLDASSVIIKVKQSHYTPWRRLGREEV